MKYLDNKKVVSKKLENVHKFQFDETILDPNSLAWLENVSNWNDSNFEEVKVHWEKTSSSRLPSKIQVESWPQLENPLGYELISIDFDAFFPGKSDSIFDKIDDMVENQWNITILTRIKDRAFRDSVPSLHAIKDYSRFFCFI